MILASQVVEELQKLIEKYGDLPVIYSTDDEGNFYEKVLYLPNEFLVNDLNQRNLITSFMDNNFIPNCFIIN